MDVPLFGPNCYRLYGGCNYHSRNNDQHKLSHLIDGVGYRQDYNCPYPRSSGDFELLTLIHNAILALHSISSYARVKVSTFLIPLESLTLPTIARFNLSSRKSSWASSCTSLAVTLRTCSSTSWGVRGVEWIISSDK